MTRARKKPEETGGERILVVDDSPDTLELIERHLAEQGYRVRTATRADEALAVLASSPVDLVVTDIRMPGRSGYDLIDEVREHHPGIEIIVVTGYATIEGAVKAMQAGAWNYLAKPFTDEELFHAVRQVLGRRARQEGARSTAHEFHGLVGESRAMRGFAEALSAAAAGDAPVLVTGEAGSGRESAARVLHTLSGRPGTFQRVGFAARAGADDAPQRAALAAAEAAAAGGTLYAAAIDVAREDARALLDECAAHAKRGAARIVCSSSVGPAELSRLGASAASLVRRAAHVVHVPPLRERGDDVLRLARHFLAGTAAEAHVAPRTLGDAAERALLGWVWPGNVGELRELCVRLALAGGDAPVGLGELPLPLTGATAGTGAGAQSLEAAEREHIARVLQRTGGNKSRAAEILGIDRKTLREKLRTGDAGAGDAGER